MREVLSATYLGGHRLLLEFDNHEKRVYDREEFGFKGVFKFLEDEGNFQQVQIVRGALTWFQPDDMEIDLCPDSTYDRSTPIREGAL
ncbi:MAG: DUF2442 domain-containing protein [Turicibacter sp.]|nr:DUF2442 domain-containing protein [Turicibacter sp.]